MRYCAELHYLQEQRGFPFPKAVAVTAKTVAHWCDHFYAEIIAPTTRQVKPLEKGGPLPNDLQAKEAFVADLLQWLFENSVTDTLFCLLLSDADGVAKFDHPDDTCCWVLNVSDDEFAELQLRWRDEGLPEDLFYPEGKAVRIPYPGRTTKARLLRALGVQKCYTPKQWEREQGNNLTSRGW
jgi:hypothetical protein